jgi:hypothetical protein
MNISFGTKEEHKREQQKAFLALSPAERFYSFLRTSRLLMSFPQAENLKKDTSKNFVIDFTERSSPFEKGKKQ